MKKINLAIWSLGRHALKSILPAIINTNLINLVGLHTRNQSVLNEQSAIYNCIAYEKANDMLNDIQIDAIYIASPISEHYAQAKEALEKGKHILVEKSAFLNFNETQQIVNLAKNTSLLVMEAFMYKFHNQISVLEELLQTKKYGDILFMEANLGIPHLEKSDIRYFPNLGGGALNDIGTYPVSIITQLLKQPVLKFRHLIQSESYSVDTSGLAIFQKEHIRGMAKWVLGGSYTNELIVWCEKGIIKANRIFSKPPEYSSTIQITNNNEIVEEITAGQDNHFINMFNYFSKTIQNKNAYSKEYSTLLNQARYLEEIR